MKEKNKEKGFTLIELLAVIVILAVIALIAVPVITSIISDSEQGALKTTVQNLISAVENNCNVEKINDKSQTYIYKLTEQGVFPSVVNLKGKLPTSGYIYVDGECNASAVNLSNGEYYVNGKVEDLTLEREALSTSPVTGAIANYYYVIDGVVIPDGFDINKTEFNNLTVNGVLIDSDENVVMTYYGFASKDLNVNSIESFIEQLKTKELLVEGKNIYEEIYYYIDYENGYSYVLCNVCALTTVCNNKTNVYEGFEISEAEFIEYGGLIHNF